jgi:hypothetical protein
VAGDRHRYKVAGAGASHRASSPGLADAPHDFGVARGPARGDRLQRLPDATLEDRSLHVQRQFKYALRLLDISDHPGDPAPEFGVGRLELRLREACPQALGQRLRILAELDGADALARGGDQDPSQCTGHDGMADGLAVHAGGPDRIDEFAVSLRVAARDGLPAPLGKACGVGRNSVR